MKKDVLFALGDSRALDDQEIEFLSTYWTSSCFGSLIDTVIRKDIEPNLSIKNKQNRRNITHELMKYYMRNWLSQHEADREPLQPL